MFWIPPIREVSLLLGGVDAGRAFAKKVRGLVGAFASGRHQTESSFFKSNQNRPDPAFTHSLRFSFVHRHQALRDGYSVSLYPGGSKEIYTTDPYTPKTELVLRIRRGFVKLALQFGTPLVPVRFMWMDATGFPAYVPAPVHPGRPQCSL